MTPIHMQRIQGTGLLPAAQPLGVRLSQPSVRPRPLAPSPCRAQQQQQQQQQQQRAKRDDQATQAPARAPEGTKGNIYPGKITSISSHSESVDVMDDIGLASPASPLEYGPVDGEVIPVSGTLMLELVLGRLAMVGFVGSGLVSLFRGEAVLQQAAKYPDNVLLVSLAVVASSLFVRSVDRGLEVRFLPAWDLSAELLNGRLAMMGFAAVVAWEIIWRLLGAMG